MDFGVLLAVVGWRVLCRVGDLVLQLCYAGEGLVDGGLALSGNGGDGFDGGDVILEDCRQPD